VFKSNKILKEKFWFMANFFLTKIRKKNLLSVLEKDKLSGKKKKKLKDSKIGELCAFRRNFDH
jgi:hypothetical protein